MADVQYLPTRKRLGGLYDAINLALNQEYGRILAEASAIVKRGQMICNCRSEFVAYAEGEYGGFYAELAIAMSDGESYNGLAWELVYDNFDELLCNHRLDGDGDGDEATDQDSNHVGGVMRNPAYQL